MRNVTRVERAWLAEERPLVFGDVGAALGGGVALRG
jgi:hypothetical protein